MKLTASVLGTLLLALALGPALVAAAPTPSLGPVPQEQESHEEEEETQLAKYMDKINGTLRQLRKSIEAESYESAIRDVCVIQRTAIEAKDEVPQTLADLEGEERQEMLAEYRKQMHVLIRGLLDLESALLDGDAEAAADKVRALGGVKKAGHRQFK